MQKDNLHGTGICKNDEFVGDFPLAKKTIDFVLDLGIFPVWLLIRITEHQNDFISVVLILVLEPSRDIGCTLDVDCREAVGGVPQIQGNQAIEVMIILVTFTNHTDSVLTPDRR